MADENAVLTVAGYLGCWFATTGIVYKVSNQVELTTSEEVKKFTSYWLNKTNPNDLFKGGFYSIDKVFDTVFGKKHFSWKTFSRSIIASLISYFLLFSIIIIIQQEEGLNIVGVISFSTILSLFGFLLSTILMDFTSLLETRQVLNILTKTGSSLKVIGLLILDFVATYLVNIMGMVIIVFISKIYDLILIGKAFEPVSITIALRIPLYFVTSFFDPGDSSKVELGLTYSLLFAFTGSTFLTSFWIYLHIISGLILQIKKPAVSTFYLLKRSINIKEKPFLSLGIVLNLIITVGFLAGLPFVIF